MKTVTMYGFEGLVDGVWSQSHCGEQGPSNYLETREQAFAELPNLAECLECDLDVLRVIRLTWVGSSKPTVEVCS
jgi:hypothetical protein